MEKFKKMKSTYAKSVGKGNPGLDIHGNPIKDQTRSIWFGREKIAYLLENTDQEEGGIRIFLGQYDEDTVPEEFSHLKEKLDSYQWKTNLSDHA